MAAKKLVTLKVTEETMKKVKEQAFVTGKKLYEVAEELITNGTK